MALPTPLPSDASPVTATVGPSSGVSDKTLIGGGPPPFCLSLSPPVNYTTWGSKPTRGSEDCTSYRPLTYTTWGSKPTRGSEDCTSYRPLTRCHHRPGTVSKSYQYESKGVIIAAIITVLAVVAIAIAYMYRHKGSYRTNEAISGEASKALRDKADSNEETQEDDHEEKQEYMM